MAEIRRLKLTMAHVIDVGDERLGQSKQVGELKFEEPDGPTNGLCESTQQLTLLVPLDETDRWPLGQTYEVAVTPVREAA